MSANINNILSTEMELLRAEISRNIQAAGKQVSGKTAASLSYNISGGNSAIDVQLTAAPQLATLESGRAPAKSGGDTKQFLQNLREWILAKGLPVRGDDELERLAQFLKWRINKFGTKLYQQGGRKDIYTPAIENFEKRLHNILTNHYKNEITKLL